MDNTAGSRQMEWALFGMDPHGVHYLERRAREMGSSLEIGWEHGGEGEGKEEGGTLGQMAIPE